MLAHNITPYLNEVFVVVYDTPKHFGDVIEIDFSSQWRNRIRTVTLFKREGGAFELSSNEWKQIVKRGGEEMLYFLLWHSFQLPKHLTNVLNMLKLNRQRCCWNKKQINNWSSVG